MIRNAISHVFHRSSRCNGWNGWIVDRRLTLGSHFKRVVGYARTSDYVYGAAAAAFAPAALIALERFAPSHVGKGGFPKALRLAGGVGIIGGFLYFYQRSCRTSTTCHNR